MRCGYLVRSQTMKKCVKTIHFQSGEIRCETPPALGVRASDGSAARKLRWMLILLEIALGLAPQVMRGQPTDPKFSSCLNSCFNVCNSGPEMLQWGCREGCGRQCEEEAGPPPPPIYGAIAWGTRSAQGISWNQGTWAAADRMAIASCSRYGSDCKVVYRYQSTCAALAVAKGAQHFESATGDTEKKAEANATAACQKRWGTCVSDLSGCSFAKTAAPNQPNPPNRAPQAHATSWGAIAYSAPDMQAGWSSSKNDKALAEQEAMRVCSQRGRACALQTVFNKQCAALARDRTFVGLATSADPRETQRKAIDECVKGGGTRCVLQVFFCSF